MTQLEKELLKALKDLRALCDKACIPLVNSHAVRDMGKFMKACEAADAVIAEAEAIRLEWRKRPSGSL